MYVRRHDHHKLLLLSFGYNTERSIYIKLALAGSYG